MRVLFVHQHLGAFGGAETNIHLTANELQRRGHPVALLYRNATGRNEESWRQTFPESFCLASADNRELVEAVLDRFRPDLIYLHNLADLEVIEALVASPVPVVRMVHDHALYCMRTYKYNYFTRKICTRAASPYCVFPCLASLGRNPNEGSLPLRWLSYTEKRKEIQLNQRCARLVVYSEYQKAELIRNGFAQDKIDLCVPIRMWSDEGLVSSFSARNLILFAGQIIRGKGVDVLLEALAKITEPFECLVLGDGNHRQYCEQLCNRLGLNGRVQFRGYLLPGELKDFYLDATVFVMSSLWPEPFGMAGPEAMRYGLPVVAFDAGGIREWLHDGQNGYLVPWKDTDLFAARVEDLLRNKELARHLGRQGLAGVRQYDSSQQVDGLERMFL
ncbi:MAG TPA: glycosyltransferase family 4 protein, partial [Candidatus Sulfotelmatobacter sp.]|nr:glycosyltransferase family 4 protein [Candidatus Sulfotelmatobacter sp.]